MVSGHPEFVIADYAVFASTIVISLGIGIYYALSGGKQRTASEYLVGNRQMTILPVALSLMVSFESSIMMLGFPAEGYCYGIMFWLYNLAPLLINFVGIRMIVPLIFPLKLTSVYEYFELRFRTPVVRMFSMLCGMLSYIFYMGIVLFGPATALESAWASVSITTIGTVVDDDIFLIFFLFKVTDFPYWASVIVVAGVSMLYTAIGGLKAVIWTDVFQTLVMLMGIFSILIKGTMFAGGLERVVEINRQTGRLYMFNFDTDPTIRHTFWTLVVGNLFKSVSRMINQSTIQRISSTPKQSDANKVLLVTGPAFFITLTLALLEGLVAYAYYYTKGCDPLTSGKIKNPNQIIPFMVLDIFKNLPGMPGLFMASLFSASLSTLSSGLSSLSAMTTEDIVRKWFKDTSEKRITLIAKLSVFLFGGLAVCVSFMIAEIKGPVSQVSTTLLSAFNGPISGMFLYAVFCPWATSKNTLFGGIISFFATFWISMGQRFSKSLKRQPWLEMRTDLCFSSNTTHNDTETFNSFSFSASLPVISTDSNTQQIPMEMEGLDKIYSVSYMWIATIGILIVFFFGSASACLLGKPRPDEVDVRFMMSFFETMFPCLPKSLVKKLYFGIPFEKRKELLSQYKPKHYAYIEHQTIIAEETNVEFIKDLETYEPKERSYCLKRYKASGSPQQSISLADYIETEQMRGNEDLNTEIPPSNKGT